MLRRMVIGLVVTLAAACGAQEGGEGRMGGLDGAGGVAGSGATTGGAGGRPATGGSAGTVGGTSAEGTMFAADDEGYVVMEMESVSIPVGHEWIEQTDLSDYTGTGYYRFVGNSICNGPAGSPLRYEFEVRDGGRYELRLRAAKIAHCVEGAPQGNGNCSEHDRTCTSLGEPVEGSCGDPNHCVRTDISNDVFVHVEDSTGNYVAFVEQPGGSIGEPVKLFGGSVNSWGWTGKRALDRNGKWDAHWDLEPGDYALVIHGRSQAFRVDRLVWFDTERGSISGAEERAETLR